MHLLFVTLIGFGLFCLLLLWCMASAEVEFERRQNPGRFIAPPRQRQGATRRKKSRVRFVSAQFTSFVAENEARRGAEPKGHGLLDNLSKAGFGSTKDEAIKKGVCICCKLPIAAHSPATDAGRREYLISGIYGDCSFDVLGSER
jgi:hypothetical protein